MSDYSQTVLTILSSQYVFFLDENIIENTEVVSNLESVIISHKNDEDSKDPILPSLQKAFKKLITV